MTKRQLSLSRIRNKEVAGVFRSFPQPAREVLRKLRALIIKTAINAKVGDLEETLKWGEPSYLTESKVGSTVRLGWKSSAPDSVAIYFKCTADLVPVFRKRFNKQLKFGGNRSIILMVGDLIPERELEMCIALALTYHLNKKMSANKRWEFVEGRLAQ